MEEPYVEGLATHDGPESCVGDPRGRSEALTGARAGWAIEPRNQAIWGADVVSKGGRPRRGQRYRELSADPARSENLCMRGTSMRENREIPRLARRRDRAAAAQGTPRRYA